MTGRWTGRCRQAAEVDTILGNVNATLDVDLSRADLVGAYTGLRPLATDPGGHPGSTVKASREHRIRVDPNGLVRIGGGKYTTYRLMAAQTVDAALGQDVARARPSRTAELPLVGAAPLPALDELAVQLAATRPAWMPAGPSGSSPGTGPRRAEVVSLGRELDLLRPLGPDIAHLEVEVVRAVRVEAALSLDDVLARRTRLAQELADRGASIVRRVAELLAPSSTGRAPTRPARSTDTSPRPIASTTSPARSRARPGRSGGRRAGRRAGRRLILRSPWPRR